jgi:hypothetical protein
VSRKPIASLRFASDDTCLFVLPTAKKFFAVPLARSGPPPPSSGLRAFRCPVRISCFAISFNLSRVVAGCCDSSVVLFNAQTSATIGRLSLREEPSALALTWRADRLVIGCASGCILVADVSSQAIEQPLSLMEGGGGAAKLISINSEDDYAVVITDDLNIQAARLKGGADVVRSALRTVPTVKSLSLKLLTSGVIKCLLADISEITFIASWLKNEN